MRMVKAVLLTAFWLGVALAYLLAATCWMRLRLGRRPALILPYGFPETPRRAGGQR